MIEVIPIVHFDFAQDLQLFLCWDEESEEHLDSTMLSNTMSTRDEGKLKKNRKASTSESDGDSSDEVARLNIYRSNMLFI